MSYPSVSHYSTRMPEPQFSEVTNSSHESYRSIEKRYGLVVKVKSPYGSSQSISSPRGARPSQGPLGLWDSSQGGIWTEGPLKTSVNLYPAEPVRPVKAFVDQGSQTETEQVSSGVQTEVLKAEGETKGPREAGVAVFEMEVPGLGTYVGEISEGKMHGKGKVLDADGFLLYEGFFRENEFEGLGTLHCKTAVPLVEAQPDLYRDLDLLEVYASDFEGNFQASEPHGVGVQRFGDAEFFGEFKNGKADGFGIWTRGARRVSGVWAANKLVHSF